MRIKKITSIVMVILMVVSLGLAYPPTKAYAAGKIVTDAVINEGLQLTRLVNNLRASVNVAPLTYSILISDLPASTRAQEITTSFSHVRPDGSKVDSLFKAGDIVWYAYGENLAAGKSTVSAAFQQWVDSKGYYNDNGEFVPMHYESLINPSFTHMGLGHATANDEYKNYWSQLFIGGASVRTISIDPNSIPAKIQKGTALADTGITALVTMNESSLGTSYLPLFDPGKTIDGYSVSGYDPNVDAVELVSVTYKGVTSPAVEIIVGNPVISAPVITSIQATYEGGNKTIGQTVSASDFSVTAIYSDNSTQQITSGISVSPTILTTESNSITVRYGDDHSAIVVVPASQPVTLKSLAVTYIGGTKFDGDSISVSDFQAIATYTDESTKNVSKSLKLSSSKVSSTNKTVTAWFGGMSQTVTIDVKEVVATELIIQPNFTSKTEGDMITSADFRVSAKFNNGKTNLISGYVILEYLTPLKAGRNTLTFTYGSVTKTVVVEAKAKSTEAPTEAPTQAPTQAPTTAEETTLAEVTSEDSTEDETTEEETTVEDTTEEETTEEAPVKLSLQYVGGTKYVGDKITKEDFQIDAIYEDGSKVDVSEEVDISRKYCIPGDNQVVISYKGKEVIFFLTVEDKPEETTQAPTEEETTLDAVTTTSADKETKAPSTKNKDADNKDIRDLQILVFLIGIGMIVLSLIFYPIILYFKKKKREKEKELEREQKQAEKEAREQERHEKE